MDLKNVRVKDYFDINNYYEKEFGKDKVIILMQVGSFHECYGTDMHGANVPIIANKLEISYTMKDKKKPLSKSNPYMIGFPVYVVDNWIEKLINLNYNVVVIDQVTPPPNPKRALREVYTPATYFKNDNNEMIEKSFITCLNFVINNNNMIIGYASYNVKTGNGFFYENYSNPKDPYYNLDEISNILDRYPSKQFLINFDNDKTFNKLSRDEIVHYLNISDENTRFIDNNEDFKNINKSKNQKQLLSQVFNLEYNNQIFDEIDISMMHISLSALCYLLSNIMKHQELLLRKINLPKKIINENKLYYGNKPLEQLDIINENKNDLFSIINKNKTNMGKRFLRDQLTNPITNKKLLNKRYKDINNLLKLDNKFLEENLKEICDIEKLLRKIQTEKIVPNQFFSFYSSLKNIINIFENKEYKKIFKIKKDLIKSLKNLSLFVENTFDLDYLSKCNFYNYVDDNKSLFNLNIYQDVDELVSSIINNNNYIKILSEELSKQIIEKKNGSKITIKTNERDGTHMILTNKRYLTLMSQLKTKKIKKISVLDMEIDIDKIEFKPISNKKGCNIKIIVPQINDKMKMVNINMIKLAKLNKQYFGESMNKVLDYNEIILKSIHKIEYIDFISSGSIVAKTLGYCCPKIEEKECSYFKAKELRHPIVETLFDDIEYYPHDINLGYENKGIILYGINGSGKSTLMKSIGINIIMAQIGYFVAAKEFIFSPYKSIFTRIKGNDNLFKKMSSFFVEMSELKAILQRNDKNTLVLADELCRGTEYKSATIIVSYMLNHLTLNNTSFITATHLHNIIELPIIKKLENVSIKHISVDYDNKNNNLIFSRKLKEGSGEDFYGLKVAKFLLDDEQFNIITNDIEKEYLENVENLNLNQTNKYNSDLMIKECYMCKSRKNLEVHHINWQKDCDKYKVKNKPQIKKNSKCNLITLCRKCHDEVDRGNINISGYIETIKGKILLQN